MKELSIKEKAERYDELLKKLQEAKVDNDVCDERYCCVIDDIVPELKDSEDERIRKKLIEAVKGDMVVGGTKDKQLAIAWLEKQGEHSVSPLFTFDDVLTIQCSMAYAKFQDRELDVALKKLHDKVYDAYHDSINHNIESQDGLKGEQILANIAKTCKDEQKSWSEVDNFMYNKIKNLLTDISLAPESINSLSDWLKDLKERYTWKPSDEQIGALEHFVRSIAESGFASPYNSNTKLVYSLLNDLKKLKL